MAAKDRYCRTANEVTSVLHLAKVDGKDLMPVSQVLSFEELNEMEENFQLLELDSNLMSILSEGDRLVFRGDQNDSAVLCTKAQTFEVKAAEISNSLALVPDILWASDSYHQSEERILKNKTVLKIFYEYLEVRPCKPRLAKLKALLKNGQYCGPEYEVELQDKGVKLLTFYDLLESVQASEEELLTALTEGFALSINGYWRLIDFDYHFRVLSLVLGVIEENSWPLNAIVKEIILKNLHSVVPDVILHHILDWYTEPNGESTASGEKLHSIREYKICRFFGEVLLRPAGKFNLQDFLSAWQQSVPEGLKTDLKYLEGIAIRDPLSKPPVINYFPESDLPEDINERFKVLFEEREKWTMEDIRPYIERLCSKKMNVNALLTKYARASQCDGVKYFSSRHGK